MLFKQSKLRAKRAKSASQNIENAGHQPINSLDINKRKLTNTAASKNHEKHKINVSFKYKLREIIHRLLQNNQSASKVAKCGSGVSWNRSIVEVFYREDQKKAKFENIWMCKKSWICPVCAARLASEKREELLALQTVVDELNLNTYMLTLSIPHTINDPLDILLEKLKIVQSKFIDALGTSTWKKRFSKIGHITVLELTYSEKHGWHPHLHILFVSEQFYTREELSIVEQELYRLWSAKCKLSGIKIPHKKYSVKLQNGGSASSKLDLKLINYLVKSGYLNEINTIELHNKIEKKESVTFWQIAQLANDTSKLISKKYQKILEEYALAMVQKSFVRWSKKLTNYLDMKGYNFKNREHQKKIKKEKRKNYLNKAVCVLQIPRALWKKICRAPYEIRHQILRSIESDIERLGMENQSFPSLQRLLKYLYQTKIYD